MVAHAIMESMQNQTPETILKETFGYDQFRTGQLSVINKVLAHKHALAIMPTGGGKSITYQLPAMMFEGLTLVISPLISLMKDQVDGLNTLGIPATFLNSTVDGQEQAQRMSDLRHGVYKMLYVAPERLEVKSFFSFVQQLPVDLIAIDEAHVLSQWGHDFRPSYLNILPLLSEIPGNPAILGLTATATERVRENLQELLGVSDDDTVLTGFARDNLALKIVRNQDKRDYIAKYLRENADQTGIIYAATRKQVDELTAYLNKIGIHAARYHAGLSERKGKNNRKLFSMTKVQSLWRRMPLEWALTSRMCAMSFIIQYRAILKHTTKKLAAPVVMACQLKQFCCMHLRISICKNSSCKNQKVPKLTSKMNTIKFVK